MKNTTTYRASTPAAKAGHGDGSEDCLVSQPFAEKEISTRNRVAQYQPQQSTVALPCDSVVGQDHRHKAQERAGDEQQIKGREQLEDAVVYKRTPHEEHVIAALDLGDEGQVGKAVDETAQGRRLTGQPESAVDQAIGVGPFGNLSVLTRVHIGRQLLFSIAVSSARINALSTMSVKQRMAEK